MAYHGYIPHVKKFLSTIESPQVLEIGIDMGQTSTPLIAFMTRFHKSFHFVGVDVLIRNHIPIVFNNLDLIGEQKVTLVQANSLEFLPKAKKHYQAFDVVLLDVDHNYYTVFNELQYLNEITKFNSIVLVDDYHGRWAERDLWYSENDEYRENKFASKPIETEKHGVKSAVDEFLAKNPNWFLSCPIKGEPVVLTQKKL